VSSKLQQIVGALQKASAPPPEVEFIEQLMSCKDDAELEGLLDANREKITPDFLQMMNTIITQAEQQGQQPEIVDQVRELYRTVLRFSMKKAMN
jgi:hypothetical protein